MRAFERRYIVAPVMRFHVRLGRKNLSIPNIAAIRNT